MPKPGESSKLKRFLFSNQSTAQTIAKNTFWLSFGEIFGRILRVGLIFYAARVLGAAGYGVFSYMTSLAAVLTVFSDMGVSSILIREGAGNKHSRKAYFATSLIIKLSIVLLSFLAIIILTPKITTLPLSLTLIYAIGLLTVFDALRVFGNAVFRLEERMQFEAGTNILTQIIILIGGLYALTFHPSPENLALAYMTGSAIGLATIVYLINKYIRDAFRFFRKDLVKKILVAGWPIGFSAIFGGLLVNMDTVMIGWFLNAESVGYYSAAQKPIAFLYLLPAFIIGALLPVMSRYAKSSVDKFRQLMERGLTITLLLALPLVAGLVLNSRRIIEIVYGMEFIDAALPMSVLAITILATFPGSIITHAIFAFDRQKEMVFMWIVGFIINTVLNLVLIPTIGLLGAAIASVVSQFLIIGVFYVKMQKINSFRLFRDTASIMNASLILILVNLIMILVNAPFLLILLTSVTIYFGALVALNDPTLKGLLAVVRGRDDT